MRAALESIAYQVRDVLEMMREQTGVTTRLIHADGGATSNGFLMQFTADIINAEVRTSMVAESSPLGAVMCGAIGSEVPSIEQLDFPGRAQRYQRKMSPETADDCYAGWQQAVDSVLL